MPKIVRERDDVLPALTEVFREHGFEGASLSLIGRRTSLGKGSLYHLFPGGKEGMAAAVLSEYDAWFADNGFEPLRNVRAPRPPTPRTLQGLDSYSSTGERRG